MDKDTPDQPHTTLSDQNLARLFVHLGVPVAVQSILEGETALDDEAVHALSDMISGQTPDRALLSVALSCIILDAHLRDGGQRCGEVLAMSSEMIVQDYAPLYLEQLAKDDGSSLFDRHDIEFISTIPEDLESLSDLLAVVADILPTDKKTFRRLAEILSTQSSAQALIGETVVDMMTGEAEQADDDARFSVMSTDNIVPFRKP